MRQICELSLLGNIRYLKQKLDVPSNWKYCEFYYYSRLEYYMTVVSYQNNLFHSVNVNEMLSQKSRWHREIISSNIPPRSIRKNRLLSLLTAEDTYFTKLEKFYSIKFAIWCAMRWTARLYHSLTRMNASKTEWDNSRTVCCVFQLLNINHDTSARRPRNNTKIKSKVKGKIHFET